MGILLMWGLGFEESIFLELLTEVLETLLIDAPEDLQGHNPTSTRQAPDKLPDMLGQITRASSNWSMSLVKVRCLSVKCLRHWVCVIAKISWKVISIQQSKTVSFVSFILITPNIHVKNICSRSRVLHCNSI